MRPLIQIIAMRSWGELGNLLAARTLGHLLATRLDPDVIILEAEHFFTKLTAIGNKIRNLATECASPDDLHYRYSRLVARLRILFPEDFEVAEPPAWFRKDVGALQAFFRRTKPAVVCCT